MGGYGSGWHRQSAPIVELCEKIDLADLLVRLRAEICQAVAEVRVHSMFRKVCLIPNAEIALP
jgi:hypothetical protein